MNDEARAYNSLIIAWPEIERLAADSQLKLQYNHSKEYGNI